MTTKQANAGGTAGSAKSQTGNVNKDAQKVATETIDQAKEAVSQVADQAQSKVKSRLGEGKDRVADNIDHVVTALRQSSEKIQGQDNDMIGRYVGTAANKLNDISNYVRHNDVDQIVREVEGFARREPAIALGGAFAVGLILARFLKSSTGAPNGYNQSNRSLVTYNPPNPSNNIQTANPTGTMNPSTANRPAYTAGTQRTGIAEE